MFSATAFALSSRIDFTIEQKKTGNVVYSGYEDIVEKDGKVEKKAYYKDPKGNVVQTEFFSYDSKTLQILDYEYINKLTNESTILKSTGKDVAISYRGKQEKDYKKGKITWTDTTYHGKTFNQLILKHWDSIVSGKDFEFDLFLPFRFETIPFALVLKEKTEKGERYVFAVEAQNFIVRQFAPTLEATYYDKPKRQISSFYGPTTLPINGETGEMVVVKFEFKE